MGRIKRFSPTLLVPLVLACSLSAHAQDAHGVENLDLTMKLLPEGAKDAAPITRQIELPAVPPQGTGTGRGASDGKPPLDGPGAGQDTAAEARERGREFGQDVAQQARDSRENAGRRPDVQPPGPPDNLPGPPSTPPGQQP